MTDAFGLWFGGSHLGFGTHMPILAAVVLQARPGPVVEYGVGFYSTPLLHLLCLEMNRPLLSLEGDPQWAEKFAGMREGEKHRIVGVAKWDDAGPLVEEGTPWAVAFIDHGPDERRVVDCRYHAWGAEFVVVHDWGDTPTQQETAAMFKYKWVSAYGPHTAVLSNFRQFTLGGP